MPATSPGKTCLKAFSLYTQVEHVSFVGSTNEDCHPHPLCNLQNQYAVRLYYVVAGLIYLLQLLARYLTLWA